MSYKIDIENKNGIPIAELYASFSCTELDTDYIDGVFEFDYVNIYNETTGDTSIHDYKKACAILGEGVIDAHLEALWDIVDVGELHQSEIEDAGAREYDNYKDLMKYGE